MHSEKEHLAMDLSQCMNKNQRTMMYCRTDLLNKHDRNKQLTQDPDKLFFLLFPTRATITVVQEFVSRHRK